MNSSPRYIDRERLGRGGFGEVTRVVDRRLGRVLARKVSHGELAADPDGLAREARLLAWLEHPGVPAVVDLTDSGAVLMAELDGEGLDRRLARASAAGQLLPLPLVLRVFTAVCGILASAHERGVLHLDVKPAHVRVGRFGSVKLLDWGIAHVFDPAPLRAHQVRLGIDPMPLTAPIRGVAGTLDAMSLEQAGGQRERLGPPADIFAAGVLLYQMLTGRLPFPSTATPAARVHALMSHAPEAPSTVRGDVPVALSELCLDLLELAPGDRPATFRDVLRELDQRSALGSGGQLRRYAAGETVFTQGEPGDVAVLVHTGHLEIVLASDTGETRLAVRGPGEVVGEIALLAAVQRTATVRALGPATVQTLGRAEIDAELDKLPPLLAQLVRSLASRFAHLSAQHEAVLAQHG